MDSLSIIYHDSVKCLILANVIWYAFANFVISEVYDDLLIMYTALVVHQSHWPVYCRSLSQCMSQLNLNPMTYPLLIRRANSLLEKLVFL